MSDNNYHGGMPSVGGASRGNFSGGVAAPTRPRKRIYDSEVNPEDEQSARRPGHYVGYHETLKGVAPYKKGERMARYTRRPDSVANVQTTTSALQTTAGGSSSVLFDPSKSPMMEDEDVNQGLADNFDDSLCGLGSDIASSTYNMSETLHALPLVKQEVAAAAGSAAVIGPSSVLLFDDNSQNNSSASAAAAATGIDKLLKFLSSDGTFDASTANLGQLLTGHHGVNAFSPSPTDDTISPPSPPTLTTTSASSTSTHQRHLIQFPSPPAATLTPGQLLTAQQFAQLQQQQQQQQLHHHHHLQHHSSKAASPDLDDEAEKTASMLRLSSNSSIISDDGGLSCAVDNDLDTVDGAGVVNVSGDPCVGAVVCDPAEEIFRRFAYEDHFSSPAKHNIQDYDDNRFQYILSVPTSTAVKKSEDTLSYLNQGQAYEIKIKKLGDITKCVGMKFTSRIRISFHERRFQFVEREQLSQWQQIRPNERIVEIDVPLSYGITDVQQCKSKLTVVQFDWDPNKDVAAYIKVNCISTEFTQRKHGGEKGVPFRIQIETYASNNGIMERLFVCGCQIKVFKLKGADRKHKQDRDKISKLSASEREKYQESCDCTIMTPYTGDMVYQPDDDGNNSSDNNEAANDSTNNASLFAINPEQQPQQLQQQQQQQPSSGPCSRTQTPVGIGGGPPQPPPIHLHQGQPNTASSSSSVSSSGGGGGGGGNSNNNSCSSTTEASPIEQRKQHAFTPNMRSDRGFSPAPSPADQDSFNSISGGSGGGGNSAVLEGDETAAALQHWLALHRFSQHAATFANFAATDILRLSRQEMIQICGLADGIRLFNALHAKSLAPRLTLYVCAEGERLYTAVYLERATYRELSKKLAALLAIHRTSIQDIYMIGPAGVHVKLNDEVVRNFPDECLLMCSAYTTSPVATPIEESKPFATQQQQLFTVVLSVQPKTVSNTSNVILTPPTRGLALHDHSSSVGNSGVLDIGPSNFGIQLQPLPPPPPPHLHHQSSPSSQQPPPPPRSLFRAHPIVPVVSSLPMTLPHNIASSHLIVSSQSVGSPSCIVPSHVSENLHVNVNVGPTAVVNAQYNASRIGGVATSSTSSTFGDAFIVPRVPNSNVVNSSSTNSVSSNGNNCITSHSSCGGSNNSSNIIINSSESLSLSSTSSLSPINNSGQIDFFENVAGGSSSSSNDEQMLNNSPSPNAQQQQQHHHHRQSQQQQHQNHHPQQQQRKHSHGHLSSPPMQSSGNFSRASPSLNRLNINGSNQGNSFQTPVSGPQAQFEPPCSASGSINTTTQFHS